MNKRTTDIVAYLTWIGLVVAFVAGDRQRSKFHLNQALALAKAVPHKGGGGELFRKGVFRRRQDHRHTRMTILPVHGAVAHPDPRHVGDLVSRAMGQASNGQLHGCCQLLRFDGFGHRNSRPNPVFPVRAGISR